MIGLGEDSQDDVSPSPGTKIHRYVVLRRLGPTRTSDIFAAHDPELDRKVAIKLLRHDVLVDGADRRRLIVEAQAVARIAHPNVVTVHDVGTWNGRPYVARQYIAGASVATWRKRVRPDQKRILDVFVSAGRGLAALHGAGLVHRDFNPHAALVGDDGTVRVTDLDFVGSVESLRVPSELRGEEETLELHTDTGSNDSIHEFDSTTGSQPIPGASGVFVDSPYASPEQLIGRPADARSDQFAFCVALYEALMSRLPFRGRTVASRLDRIERGEIRRPRHRVPRRIWNVIVRGLDADPARRFRTMNDLVDAMLPSRRRRVALLVPVAVLGAATAAIAGAGTDEPARAAYCTNAAEDIANVWGPQKAETIRKAFEATELPYAGDAASLARRHLDDWVDAWMTRHEQLCEDEREEAGGVAERAREMHCLELQKEELRSVVSTLSEADGGTVEHAAAIVRKLSPVDGCARGDGYVPAEGLLDEVAQLRRDLIRAETLLAAGRLDAAMEIGLRLEARARELDVQHFRLRAMALRGVILKYQGNPDGIAALHEAFSEAVAHRDYDAVSQIAVELAGDLIRKRDFDAAEQWLSHAEAAISGRPGSAQMPGRAGIESQRGRIAGMKGDFDAMLVHARRALELRREHLPSDDERLGVYRINLAQAHQWRGNNDEARSEFEAALHILEHRLGPLHPYVAQNLMGLSTVLAAQGDYADALRRAKSAESALEAVYGDRHSLVADAKLSRAMAHAGMGERGESLRLQHEGLDIYREVHGERSYRVALAMNNLGIEYSAAEQWEEAIEFHRGAVERCSEVLGEEHVTTAELDGNYAQALVSAGRIDDGAQTLESTMQTLQARLGADHYLMATPLEIASEVSAVRGDDAGAVEELEQALQIRVDSGRAPVELARIRLMLAYALRRANRTRAADALEQEARVTLIGLGRPGRTVLEDVELRETRIAERRAED